MIVAFDVVSDDPKFAHNYYRAALANEALVRPIGNTVYVMPPYILNDDEIGHLGHAVARSLEAAL